MASFTPVISSTYGNKIKRDFEIYYLSSKKQNFPIKILNFEEVFYAGI